MFYAQYNISTTCFPLNLAFTLDRDFTTYRCNTSPPCLGSPDDDIRTHLEFSFHCLRSSSVLRWCDPFGGDLYTNVCRDKEAAEQVTCGSSADGTQPMTRAVKKRERRQERRDSIQLNTYKQKDIRITEANISENILPN